jgi:hypothetical protein
MVKIYALVSGQLVLYVGKTMRSLKQREWMHRNKTNQTTSKYIPDYIDWTIQLLEEVPDNQGTAKEQHYYDILRPLYNRCRPGQTRKETCIMTYNNGGKEKIIAHNKIRQQTEEYREYQRQYRLKKKAARNQFTPQN